MGCGATPHEKETRGSAPNPATFLKRKRERKKAENAVFGGELRNFAKEYSLLAKNKVLS